MDDERPPICPSCGVTMLPADLSARDASGADWVCIECEETDGPEATADDGQNYNARRHP